MHLGAVSITFKYSQKKKKCPIKDLIDKKVKF